MIDVTKLTENITGAVNTAFAQFGVTNIDLSKFDITKIDLPAFEIPFEIPFEMTVDVPAEIDRVADLVRDVTYAGIGMWVVAAQKVDAEVRKLAAKAA